MFGEAVDPLEDRLMRAGNAEQLEHSRRLPQRQPRSVQAHPERPDGRRGALLVPTRKRGRVQRLFEQFLDVHEHQTQELLAL
jgi:hypothetical protein